LLSAQEKAKAGLWPVSEKPETSDKSSVKIIALHLRARGGAEALGKYQIIGRTGKLIEGYQDYKLAVTYSAPGSIRIESTRRHMGDDYINVSASDGSVCWRQDTVPEVKRPHALGGLDKHLLEFEAMLPFLFLDPSSAGHVFAYKGKEKFAKTEVYVLHGWLANGFQLDILFDAKSFHVINFRHAFKIGIKEVIIDRTPSGLVRFNDTWWDKGYLYRLQGKAFREISYDTITEEVVLAEDAFTPPPIRERWLKINPY